MDNEIENFNSLGLHDSLSNENVDDAETEIDDNLIRKSNLHVEIAFADGIHEVDLGNSRTYKNPIPSLEDLATLVVALRLRNTYSRIESDNYQIYVTRERRLRKMNEVIDQLSIPKSILKKIKFVTYNIVDDLIRNRLISSVHELYRICNCTAKNSAFHYYWRNWSEIVLNPNGSIDYTKTISKVLSSCHKKCAFGTDAMFQVIAYFCLEKHLNEFPIDSLSEEYVQRVQKASRSYERVKCVYQIENYWIEYKKKSQYFQNEHSILLQTLKACSNSLIIWPAYDYFWNSFDENDQIAIATNLMSKEEFRKYQMNLFSKLNRNQLRILYSKEPVNIISNFMYSREFNMVRAAWQCVRLSITGPQFEKIIETFSDEAKKTGDYVDSLIDIWNSAPPTLIDYVLNEKNFKIVDKYFSIDTSGFLNRGGFKLVEESLKFLATVLSKAKSEAAMKYLGNKGPFIIYQHDTNVFNFLIKSALSANDQQEEVKEKTLLKIVNLDSSYYRSKIMLDHYRKLCVGGQEKLNEFVEFLTTKPDLQIKLKSKLIPTNLFNLSKGYFDAADWANVSHMIDQVYPDESQSLKKKRTIILSSCKQHHPPRQLFELCFRRNGEERFDELDHILTPILTKDEMIKFKEQIITLFRVQLFKDRCPSIRHINMDRFVHWCFSGNIKKMSRFKSRFPIRKVFHIVFAEIVRNHTAVTGSHPKDVADLSFAPLNSLLCWKFPSKVKRYEFKEKQIMSMVEDPTGSSYLWKNYEDELEKIIRWFFGGIKWKIRNFNQTYSNDDKKLIIESCNVEEITSGCEEYYCYRSDLSSSDWTIDDE